MSVIKCAVILLLLLQGAIAKGGVFDNFTDALSFSGYLKNETAYRYIEPRSFTKMRNIAALRINYAYNDSVELTVSSWAYYDLVYLLFDYDTVTARAERDILQPLNFIEGLGEQKDSGIIDVRELYLDIFLDNLDLRIGRQHVVWGVMTGVRIVDEINPMDFRELILPDLLDYRVPLWTLKANYYRGNSTFELLLIPDIRFHLPGPQGSEWELLQEVPGTVYPQSFTLKNMEYGLKWSSTLWDTELSLSYFNTWDDFPVIFRKVRVDRVVETPLFFPTYTRIQMFGTTFQRLVAGVVVKGEGAFVTGKYFGLETVDRDGDGYLDNQGEAQRNHIRWGLALDFNLFKTDFSPGITQWIILNYDEAIIQDRFDTAYNLFVRKELTDRSAVFQLLIVGLLNLKEIYLKPELIFNISNRFQLTIGLDVMTGLGSQVGVAAENGRAVDLLEIEQRFQFIGNFNNNDRLFMDFKYSF